MHRGSTVGRRGQESARRLGRAARQRGGTVGPVTQYVALLRGVNVGKITVKSADLADMARGLGLDDVRTVLATGNLTFTSPATAPALKKTIEDGLRDRFGYDAWIVLTTADHLRDVIDAFPFPERDAYQPYVLFGSDTKVLGEIERAAGTWATPTTGRARRPGPLLGVPEGVEHRHAVRQARRQAEVQVDDHHPQPPHAAQAALTSAESQEDVGGQRQQRVPVVGDQVVGDAR